MPQMKPTKWTLIIIFSSMTMMMTISSMYFTNTQYPLLSPPTSPPMLNKKNTWSWKW